MGISKKARLEGQKKMGMIVQVSLFPIQNWCRIVGRSEVDLEREEGGCGKLPWGRYLCGPTASKRGEHMRAVKRTCCKVLLHIMIFKTGRLN